MGPSAEGFPDRTWGRSFSFNSATTSDLGCGYIDNYIQVYIAWSVYLYSSGNGELREKDDEYLANCSLGLRSAALPSMVCLVWQHTDLKRHDIYAFISA